MDFGRGSQDEQLGMLEDIKCYLTAEVTATLAVSEHHMKLSIDPG